MIDFEKAQKNFQQYLQGYDLDNGKIQLKVRHTYEVVRVSQYIAEEIDWEKEKIELAKLIGLLHDIGRFEQLKRFNHFDDKTGVDHAKLGNKILFQDGLIRDFIQDNSYDTIISKAILNHNTLKIEEGLKQEELVQAKIIRDADKIDNFRVKVEDKFECIMDNANKEKLENSIVSDKIYDEFMNNRLIVSEDRKTYLDKWISSIAFLFDFNFSLGLKYIKQMDYINKMVDRIDYKNLETRQQMQEIRKHAIEYVDNRILEENEILDI